MTAPLTYACLGDSITSDQVTGIGTRIAQMLGLRMIGNFACGYATCSDWHSGLTNTTTITLDVPPNTNTDDNVLSNQVRRLLAATTPKGQPICWHHPVDGDFSLPESVGLGLGLQPAPDIIYIAISTNDGNHPQNVLIDDVEDVLLQPYRMLTRCSIASALRWAVETLQCAYPGAAIFVATPLQAVSDQPWMSYGNTLHKRNMIIFVCRACGVKVIDSFYESGFSTLIAREHGEVHPDDLWKENIARFVAAQIQAKCCMCSPLSPPPARIPAAVANYHKLVRDRIPEIIKASGKFCTCRVLSDEEYLDMLDAKLNEELAEYQESKSMEELADLLEVIQAAAKARGSSMAEVEALRAAKAEARGSFDSRLLLMEVHTDT